MREKPGRRTVIVRSAISASALLISALVAFPVFAYEPVSPAVAETARESAQIARYQPRFGRSHPVIAVVGENAGTELIDFVIPYGILSESGAAEVLAVATDVGAIQMRPALRIQPHATIDTFDQRFPDGADYVIVPAMMIMDKTAESVLLGWIKAQADKGATVVSICDGAMIVAKTGLMKGHRATGHWATQARREHDFPDTQWLVNTRYVADGKVISSAGVTAAIPLSLALVEAISGTDRAAQVAQDLGVSGWSAQHDSEQFHAGMGMYAIAIRNFLSFRRDVGVPVAAGVDDISLALTADAYSRTFRSHAYTVASSLDAIQTRHGLTLLPDRIANEKGAPRYELPVFDSTPSLQVLDSALTNIAMVYGRSTAHFVALQLEYPQRSH
jgi:putative intracellular protease/amidase